jgi:predicted RNase H-like HicB family nuclease
MKLIYPAVFKRLENNPNGFCVILPDLPGCLTQGSNLENAIEMAQDAASGWILTAIEDGEALPPPSAHTDIKLEANDFISFIQLDMDVYTRRFSTKAVKKTLSIPQWLNNAAEEKNINFSQVLQEALKEKLGLRL